MSSLAVDLIYLLPPGVSIATVYIIRREHRKSLVSDPKFKPVPKRVEDVSDQLELYQEPPEKPKVYESFGHPAPPILLLKASMPSAPIGYAWEITTGLNDEGHPALKLAFMDMKTGLVIDSIEGDLVIIRKWRYAKDDTYADFYRRCEEQDRVAVREEKLKWENSVEYAYDRQMRSMSRSYYDPPMFKPKTEPGLLAGKVMLANLITPIVDWASLITLRYIVEHPTRDTCTYELIEGVTV